MQLACPPSLHIAPEKPAGAARLVLAAFGTACLAYKHVQLYTTSAPPPPPRRHPQSPSLSGESSMCNLESMGHAGAVCTKSGQDSGAPRGCMMIA